jgi:hypothetical protein
MFCGTWSEQLAACVGSWGCLSPLCQYGGVLFSADDWILTLMGDDFPVERFNEYGDNVKQVGLTSTFTQVLVQILHLSLQMIWSVASDLIQRHRMDVILDFSFWQRCLFLVGTPFASQMLSSERSATLSAAKLSWYERCAHRISQLTSLH